MEKRPKQLKTGHERYVFQWIDTPVFLILNWNSTSNSFLPKGLFSLFHKKNPYTNKMVSSKCIEVQELFGTYTPSPELSGPWLLTWVSGGQRWNWKVSLIMLGGIYGGPDIYFMHGQDDPSTLGSHHETVNMGCLLWVICIVLIMNLICIVVKYVQCCIQQYLHKW